MEVQAETTRVLPLRVYPTFFGNPTFLEPCWSVPGPSVVFSLVERIGTWSSGLVRTDHAPADQPRGCREKKPKPFLSYRLPYGLTPAAESFSSPGLLEDSAHWSIAEPCRNSSTPCEVGCDQKLASDSSGLSGGFSGQRAWVRILKKWAPGSYCLELVVACPAAGTSAQFLLVGGSLKANSF
ncbi:hypothetical protein GEV33_005521 [Tenebrio molitor]|uniref:Uncharacterized protein n=1 Tax=Tenebrio molitor TaxID=7067 RepID=A0A8J6HEE0_TENMO|nr:hypothetical protein GEV33_005521 [Tenebrio molitor]